MDGGEAQSAAAEGAPAAKVELLPSRQFPNWLAERPFVFAQVKAGRGVEEIAAFVEKLGGLRRSAHHSVA